MLAPYVRFGKFRRCSDEGLSDSPGCEKTAGAFYRAAPVRTPQKNADQGANKQPAAGRTLETAMSDLLVPTIAEAYRQAADAERRATTAETSKARKEWQLVAKQWRLIIENLERRVLPAKPPTVS
jgi:hypothetical protein